MATQPSGRGAKFWSYRIVAPLVGTLRATFLIRSSTSTAYNHLPSNCDRIKTISAVQGHQIMTGRRRWNSGSSTRTVTVWHSIPVDRKHRREIHHLRVPSCIVRIRLAGIMTCIDYNPVLLHLSNLNPYLNTVSSFGRNRFYTCTLSFNHDAANTQLWKSLTPSNT